MRATTCGLSKAQNVVWTISNVTLVFVGVFLAKIGNCVKISLGGSKWLNKVAIFLPPSEEFQTQGLWKQDIWSPGGPNIVDLIIHNL